MLALVPQKAVDLRPVDHHNGLAAAGSKARHGVALHWAGLHKDHVAAAGSLAVLDLEVDSLMVGSQVVGCPVVDSSPVGHHVGHLVDHLVGNLEVDNRVVAGHSIQVADNLEVDNLGVELLRQSVFCGSAEQSHV